jgi:glutathione S-transferase
MELLIGDKNLSSWSMRPWLALKRTGSPFAEVMIKLRQEATPDVIRAAGSPSGLVPVLMDGESVIWDTLAICEYLAERFPAAHLWPEDAPARAMARCAAAEMHAGFASLRGQCPMDIAGRVQARPSEATATDIRRIVELWSALLVRFGGPFLAGPWSIADAFFTPVATRFRSYGIDLASFGDDGAGRDYAGRLLATPEFLEWEKGALAEVA